MGIFAYLRNVAWCKVGYVPSKAILAAFDGRSHGDDVCQLPKVTVSDSKWMQASLAYHTENDQKIVPSKLADDPQPHVES